MAPSDTVTAVVDAYGTGSITMGGISRNIAERGEKAARALIMSTVLAYARDSHRAVILTAKDSEGQTQVVIHPDGRVEPAPPIPAAVEISTGPVPAPRRHTHTPTPPTPRDGDTLSPDIEHTVFVSRQPHAQGWQLTFSTGSVATVWGTGLIGRRPQQDADEPRDHIIAVDDRTRTVSRLHLEFGSSDGRMWICDRRSANGTRMIRGREYVDCIPGQRYWVAPGTLVEIGDHTFTVSLSDRKGQR